MLRFCGVVAIIASVVSQYYYGTVVPLNTAVLIGFAGVVLAIFGGKQQKAQEPRRGRSRLLD